MLPYDMMCHMDDDAMIIIYTGKGGAIVNWSLPVKFVHVLDLDRSLHYYRPDKRRNQVAAINNEITSCLAQLILLQRPTDQGGSTFEYHPRAAAILPPGKPYV